MDARTCLVLLVTLAACSSTTTQNGENADAGHADTAAVDVGEGVSDAATADVAVSDVDEPPLQSPVELMTRLGGLWVGPANQTPLGDFPIMAMDFRAADPNVLFARSDLDAGNALRMAFFIEQIGDTADLVFRNGGLFMGLSRDTKAVLEAYDPDASTWKFCEPTGGCDYLNAVISFVGANELTMDVKVRGEQHMLWTATREETRALPDPFPAKLDPIGTGDADFPEMPTLDVELSWADAAPAGAWVWATLSDTPCGLTGTACQASRSIGAALDEGATSATLRFEQLHADSYHLNAVLDRDGNFQTVPFPQNPDAIVYPVDPAVDVEPGESSTSHTISFDVP